ncbi:MAG: MnhB domain-containing protein [Lachnospiraceae bacterium]|nr:MnhB domain-containing protein [Lachnospiraceae bacterium]
MSRRKDNYENSRWLKFKRWVDGETDTLTAERMESAAPEEKIGSVEFRKEAAEAGGKETTEENTDSKAVEMPAVSLSEKRPGDFEPAFRGGRGIRMYNRFYQIMSILLCLSIIFVLLWTIAYLPIFGNAGNPDNNEVSARYIEQGLKETGAVNIVTGMILDYRAFDTFGESCVLFIASCCVLVLLRIDSGSQDERTKKRLEEANDRLFEPKNDIILQKCACVLVPVILVFGIYIVLNGHLSPGGGFSGGAVLGSGLILYLNAFGFEKTEKLFHERIYRRITVCALTFYCLAKSYSFFTGANHLESGIPLGTPGAILSSGLILPLNICVGLVVACTMYAFYTLFRKGGM